VVGVVLLAVDPDDDPLADAQAAGGDLLVAGVEGEVAEAVDGQHVGDELRALHPRLRQLERHELAGLERLAGGAQRRARGELRGDRREEVAPVEGRRHGAQAVRRLAQLHRLDHAAELLGRGQQQAVVGTDEQAVLLGAADRHRARLPPTSGSTTAEMHARRRERQRAPQDERPVRRSWRAMPWVRSTTRTSGAMRAMTAWQTPTKSSAEP
jgi:hypothetical protein